MGTVMNMESWVGFVVSIKRSFARDGIADLVREMSGALSRFV